MSSFGEHRVLHFELRTSEGGFAPQALASVAPLLAGLRDAAAQRLRDVAPERAPLFERLISGRGAGPRDLAQRIRLVPIPSVDTTHTDPSIRRVMVEVPSACPIRVDDLKWAFAGLQPLNPSTGEVGSGRLVSTVDTSMVNRLVRVAQVFRSLTPAVLPDAQRRRIEVAGEKRAEERSREEVRAAGAVIQSLRHAGLRVRPSDIRVQREPFQRRGVRAELFANESRFSMHTLWHVELRFREAISGPLVIGDGRFCGLGLMEPVTACCDVFAFSLGSEPRIAPEDRPILVRSLRRALMALARDESGHVRRLFSGHESDGRSDSAGHHAHVFLAADGGENREEAITRLVVAAPWAVDCSAKPQRGDRRQFDRVIRQLGELRAGRLGRFDHLKAEPVEEGDPLLGPTTTWIGRTPYVATRNLKKRDDPEVAVKSDVTAECVRRGLPIPVEIQVSDASVGPRGGRPAAKLELRFATAVRGPLLLGRDSHAGGGLFHAAPSQRRVLAPP